MNPTRKMWVSAGVVGVIVVGGASVAAAASAGRIQKVSHQETRAVVEQDKTPQSATPSTPAAQPDRDPEDIVVSHEVNSDPNKVVEYWTDERMEGAEPMPMPEVVIQGDVKPAG